MRHDFFQSHFAYEILVARFNLHHGKRIGKTECCFHCGAAVTVVRPIVRTKRNDRERTVDGYKKTWHLSHSPIDHLLYEHWLSRIMVTEPISRKRPSSFMGIIKDDGL